MTSWIFLFAFSLFSVLSCRAQGSCSSCKNGINLAIMNTFQEVGTPFQAQRLQAIVDYFNASEYELICINGIYNPIFTSTLLKKLEKRFPFAFLPPPVQQQCSKGCLEDEIISFTYCLEENNCTLLPADEGELCAKTACVAELSALPLSCQACLGIGFGQIPVSSLVEECSVTSAKDIDPGCIFLKNGYSDSLIISDTELVTTSFYRYNHTTEIARTIAFAEIESRVQNSTLSVFCTHLTDPSDIDSEEENSFQIQELLNYVNTSTTKKSGLVALLGDFQVGPAIGGNVAVDLKNYQTIVNAGYIDAYISVGGKECTLCASNPLNANNTSSLTTSFKSFIIDHIFVEKETACIQSSSVFGDNVTALEENGERIPLSTHQGVEAVICSKENESSYSASSGMTSTSKSVTALHNSATAAIPLIALIKIIYFFI